MIISVNNKVKRAINFNTYIYIISNLFSFEINFKNKSL